MPGKEDTAAPTAATTSQVRTTPTKPDSEKSAAEMASETRDAAAERAETLAERAKSEAAGLVGQAKTAADARAEEAKDYATSNIEETAEQVRRAGREFGEDSYQAQAADYVAQNLQQAATMIRDTDLDTVISDVSNLARRNPTLFLGGAAILGFAAARLLKASDRAPRYDADFDRPPSGMPARPGAPGVGVRPQPTDPARYAGGVSGATSLDGGYRR